MILIVDDYADGGRALSRLLAITGYGSEWVADGATAIAMIRAHPPQQALLVVLDEMMPQMTGLQVLRHLKSDPTTAGVAVVVYSAKDDDARRDEAMTLGAWAWIRKSACNHNMVSEIVRWYEQAGGAKRAVVSSP